MDEYMIWVVILPIVSLVLYQLAAQYQVNSDMNRLMNNEVAYSEVKNNPECPVQVSKIKISVPARWQFPCCWVEFYNVSDKIVNTVKYKIVCYDSFGTPVGQPPHNQLVGMIQDETAQPQSNFGFNKYIALPKHATTRRAEIIIERVLFSNGSVWELEEPSIQEFGESFGKA